MIHHFLSFNVATLIKHLTNLSLLFTNFKAEKFLSTTSHPIFPNFKAGCVSIHRFHLVRPLSSTSTVHRPTSNDSSHDSGGPSAASSTPSLI
ncbi:hypothetical protein Hanom_Chr16g01475151 [Helianthus anomalus]